jgi:hypothetical protein
MVMRTGLFFAITLGAAVLLPILAIVLTSIH